MESGVPIRAWGVDICTVLKKHLDYIIGLIADSEL